MLLQVQIKVQHQQILQAAQGVCNKVKDIVLVMDWFKGGESLGAGTHFSGSLDSTAPSMVAMAKVNA